MAIVVNEVMFDTTLLSSVSGLTVLEIKHYLPPTQSLTSFILARTDSRKTNTTFATERHILIKACIQASSRAERDTRFDSLLAIIQGTEKQIIVPHGAGQRSFTASYSSIQIDADTGSYIEFTIDFLCSDNFGYDLGFTQLLYAAGRTLYNYTDSFTIEGSAEWQAPIIKITFTALTGGTNVAVVVKNEGTGQSLSVQRTWLAGDVLVVDAQNRTVKVNGTDVEFNGAIPLWKRGAGYLRVYDGFLTRTKTEYMYYYRRWV